MVSTNHRLFPDAGGKPGRPSDYTWENICPPGLCCSIDGVSTFGIWNSAELFPTEPTAYRHSIIPNWHYFGCRHMWLAHCTKSKSDRCQQDCRFSSRPFVLLSCDCRAFHIFTSQL